ncbi:zinc finger protein [Aphelenchoides avenae]|nr:zinc finger protein [Aphelenchus avenae]
MPAKGRCVICTCDFVSTNVAGLKCGHTFHAECVTRWIETSKTCPTCRKRNTKADVVRLFFDESDPSASQQCNAEQRVETLSIELTIEKEEHVKAQARLNELETKLKQTENSLRNEKEKTSKMRLKDDKITQLELMLHGKHETEQQLKRAQDRLKACEFYTVLKGKGPSNVEDAIDSYLQSSGDIDAAKFLKMTRKQLKDVEQKLNETVAQLTKLQFERNEQDRKLTKYKKLAADLQEELSLLKKTDSSISPLNAKLKNVIDYSPQLDISRRSSIGFSFNNDSGYANELLESAYRAKYPRALKKRVIIEDDDAKENDVFGKPLNFDDSFKSPPAPAKPKELKAFSFEDSPNKQADHASGSGVAKAPAQPQKASSSANCFGDDDADISIPGSVLRRVKSAAAVPRRFASAAENAFATVENNVAAVAEARQVLKKRDGTVAAVSEKSTNTTVKLQGQKTTKRPLEMTSATAKPLAKKPNNRISSFFRRVPAVESDGLFMDVELVQLD